MANVTNSRRNRYKVVIIGAGISAFGAANLLCNEGIDDIAILEATDRIGGRIWSTDIGDHKVELGANWIHGIDLNPIFKIAKTHNLLSSQGAGRHLGKKMLFVSENGTPVNGRLVESVDMDYGMLMSECDEFYQQQQPTPEGCDSVGMYVEQVFESRIERFNPDERKLRQALLRHRMLHECIITGASSLYDLSLSDCGSFEELPGVHFVIPHGFETVIQLLKQNVPPEAIHLDHPVTKVSWKDRLKQDVKNENDDDSDYPVCIECANGKKFYAQICLVTISLGCLKKHADRMFDPPLPDQKMEAIRHIAMGTVNKVFLEFDAPVLPPGIFRLEMVRTHEPEDSNGASEDWIRKIASYEAVADTVLMGWLSGEQAEYIELLSDEEVGRRCVENLKEFLGPNKTLPNLKKVVRSSWKSNPYTLGSYCHIPVEGSVEDIKSLAEPVMERSGKPILLFAGEATHPSFYSSSHGALLSGQREAQRIIDLLQH